MADDRSGKLIIVFIMALLLFNYPLLSIVDRKELVWGIPKLYWYLFVVWALIILAIRAIVRKDA